MLNKVLDFLYPPTCLVCGNSIGGDPDDNRLPNSPRSTVLCQYCDPLRNLDPPDFLYPENLSCDRDRKETLTKYFCERCGEPMASPTALPDVCVVCQVWPPPMKRIRSLWRYTAYVEDVIKSLKYRHRRPLVHYLGEQMARVIKGDETCPSLFGEDTWDVIIPLPSVTHLMRKRGFSHTALIAKDLASHLKLKVDVTALRSQGTRLPQAVLSPKERHANVKDSFIVRNSRLAGKRVLLIDDVMTTGASLWAASSCLLSSGTYSIDALTVARSKQFHSLRLIPSQHAYYADDETDETEQSMKEGTG